MLLPARQRLVLMRTNPIGGGESVVLLGQMTKLDRRHTREAMLRRATTSLSSVEARGDEVMVLVLLSLG